MCDVFGDEDEIHHRAKVEYIVEVKNEINVRRQRVRKYGSLSTF